MVTPSRELTKGHVMAEKKKTIVQEIADLLKQNAEELPEGYTGAEWVEAVEQLALLSEPVILQIPWCVADLMVDERGVTKMENAYTATGRLKSEKDDGTIDETWEAEPERRTRFDVLAVLAWIPMKRTDPDILVTDISRMLSEGNTQEITRMIFRFWGVDVLSAEEQIRKIEEDAQNENTEVKKEEATEAGDFPE